MLTKIQVSCDTCLDTYETVNGDSCQECCEHGEYDHGLCGICGADCLDDLIALVDFSD
jgi:hypothetical protein